MIRIGPATITTRGDTNQCKADICIDSVTHELWLEYPSWVPAPVYIGDVFASAMLLPAMKLGVDIEVDDGISQMLASAMNSRIQDMYMGWDRSLKKVRVGHVLEGTVHGPPQRKKISTFSGGVDSFYTAIKNREHLSHLLLVHGFDIEVGDSTRWDMTIDRLDAASEEMGIGLLPVRTNLRIISDPLYNWEFYHGSAIASVGHLLSGAFESLYIAASHTVAERHPWGTHQDLDPLWRSDAIEFVHDGTEANRSEKMEFIVKEPAALKHLRVCWRNVGDSYNCGACEKCIRAMLNLRILGHLHKSGSFKDNLTLDDVRNMKLLLKSVILFAENNLAMARRLDADPALIEVIEYSIKNQGPASRIQKFRKSVSKFFT